MYDHESPKFSYICVWSSIQAKAIEKKRFLLCTLLLNHTFSSNPNMRESEGEDEIILKEE